jgi:hypothetical protein
LHVFGNSSGDDEQVDPSRVVQARFSSSSNEVLTADLGSRGGILEIELAQTGEGIADCELIRWFVKEVQKFTTFQRVVGCLLVSWLWYTT